MRSHSKSSLEKVSWVNISFVVMDNYKNAPQYLYGLSPSQMDMFMTEDNPVRRQSEKVTEVCPNISGT